MSATAISVDIHVYDSTVFDALPLRPGCVTLNINDGVVKAYLFLHTLDEIYQLLAAVLEARRLITENDNG